MSLPKRSKIVLIGLALVLLGVFIGYKIIYKPHPTIESQSSDFVGRAELLKSEIANDAEKWQNAIVEVEGKITSLDANGGVLNETIFCQFKTAETSAQLSEGKAVKVKGRFIGYDDLLEEIKLDQCIILE